MRQINYDFGGALMIEIRKTITFKVDPSRWAETFGLSLGEVAEDFQSYLDGAIAQALHEVMGSLDYCGGKVDLEDREHEEAEHLSNRTFEVK